MGVENHDPCSISPVRSAEGSLVYLLVRALVRIPWGSETPIRAQISPVIIGTSRRDLDDGRTPVGAASGSGASCWEARHPGGRDDDPDSAPNGPARARPATSGPTRTEFLWAQAEGIIAA